MDTLTRAWVRAWAQFSFMLAGISLSERAEKRFTHEVWKQVKRDFERLECKRKMRDHD